MKKNKFPFLFSLLKKSFEELYETAKVAGSATIILSICGTLSIATQSRPF